MRRPPSQADAVPSSDPCASSWSAHRYEPRRHADTGMNRTSRSIGLLPGFVHVLKLHRRGVMSSRVPCGRLPPPAALPGESSGAGRLARLRRVFGAARCACSGHGLLLRGDVARLRGSLTARSFRVLRASYLASNPVSRLSVFGAGSGDASSEHQHRARCTHGSCMRCGLLGPRSDSDVCQDFFGRRISRLPVWRSWMTSPITSSKKTITIATA